jgi:hypothetical protein
MIKLIILGSLTRKKSKIIMMMQCQKGQPVLMGLVEEAKWKFRASIVQSTVRSSERPPSSKYT